MDVSITHDTYGPRVLRFEARWLKEGWFKEIVEGAWESTQLLNGVDLAGRLARVHDQLHRWDRTVLKSTSKRIKSAQRELGTVARGALTDENVSRQKELAMEIEKLLVQEEIHWVPESGKLAPIR